MKRIGIGFLVVLGTISLFPQIAFSEKTKQELEAEKSKEIQEREEQARKVQKALEADAAHRKLIDLQKIVQKQQESIQEVQAFMRFPSLQFTLNKKEYAPREAIKVNLMLTNGAHKPFWVDGRLVAPVYEIRDSKRKVVSISKSSEYTLPLKKDLIRLDPKKNIIFPEAEGLQAPKQAGTYMIRGSYIFFAPEEEGKNVWTGTLTTHSISFTVLGEGKP